MSAGYWVWSNRPAVRRRDRPEVNEANARARAAESAYPERGPGDDPGQDRGIGGDDE